MPQLRSIVCMVVVFGACSGSDATSPPPELVPLDLPAAFSVEATAAGRSPHGWAVCQASLVVQLRPDLGEGRARGTGHFARVWQEDGRVAGFHGLIAAELTVEWTGRVLVVRDTAQQPDRRRPFGWIELRQAAPGRLIGDWSCPPIGTNQPSFTDLHTTAHGHASLVLDGAQ